MSAPDKDVSGAHVVSPPNITIPDPYSTVDQTLLPASPARTAAPSLSPTSPGCEEFDPSQDAKPYSPFYRHPTTRTSLEQLKSETKVYGRGCTSQDLETGTRIRMSGDMDTNCHRLSGWNQKPPKKHRALNCLRGLTKRQRLAVKLLIAFVVVGGMVGIGLGISKAVGGGFWSSKNRTSDIE
jgi:hypothetical protein